MEWKAELEHGGKLENNCGTDVAYLEEEERNMEEGGLIWSKANTHTHTRISWNRSQYHLTHLRGRHSAAGRSAGHCRCTEGRCGSSYEVVRIRYSVFFT